MSLLEEGAVGVELSIFSFQQGVNLAQEPLQLCWCCLWGKQLRRQQGWSPDSRVELNGMCLCSTEQIKDLRALGN